MSDNKLVNELSAKLAEYGIIIFRDYPMESENQHVFLAEDMVLFLEFENESVSVSFHVATKPETVAQNTKILEEIQSLKSVDIMESHIINNNNELVSGKKAFELLEQHVKAKVLVKYLKDQQYIDILQSSKCYPC